MIKIHYCSSSREAYDASMCGQNFDERDHEIHEVSLGDILVVEDEKIVGIADVWPVAVTKTHGDLHTLKEGISLSGYFAKFPGSAAKAREVAAELGFE